jgi:hypothetical protein
MGAIANTAALSEGKLDDGQRTATAADQYPAASWG